MKRVLANIFRLTKKQSWLLLTGVFLALFMSAQDTAQIEEYVDQAEDTAFIKEKKEDHFTERSEYLQADSIRLRQVPGAVVDSLKKDDAFWYADYVFKKEEVKEKTFKERKQP